MTPISKDLPTYVVIDGKEKQSQQLSDVHMKDALLALHKDGVVLLENAVDQEHIDVLNARMLEDIPNMKKSASERFNQQKSGNLSQTPPMFPGYIFTDIYDNSFALQVIRNMIGSEVEMRYLRGNTAVGNSIGRQPVHADSNFDHYHFPYGFVVNIMMCDTTPQNGATEMWLGTHTDTTIEDHTEPNVNFIKPELYEKRREVRPPVYPNMKKGTIVVRDLRMWHAGIANKQNDDRIMIALVYLPRWYQNMKEVMLPVSSKPEIEAFKNCTVVADYIEDEKYDYFNLAKFYADFSSLHMKKGTTAA